MWYLRRVVGKSMEPTLKNGQTVLISSVRSFKKGDVVIAFMNGKEVIKRITKKQNGQVYLEGDNKLKSTDSKKHGWLVDNHVMGRVIWPSTRNKN